MRLKPVRGSIIGKTSTTASNNQIRPKVEQRVGSTCVCLWWTQKQKQQPGIFYIAEIMNNQWHII